MGFTGRRVFRYLAASNSLVLTVNDLLDIMFFAADATTAYRFFSAIRLKRVSFWTPAETSGSPFPFMFTWQDNNPGPFQGIPMLPINDVSTDQARGAHHAFIPPPQTMAAAWLTIGDTDTTSIFNVTYAPSGTIMDLEIEYVLAPNTVTGPVVTARAITGATQGNLYTSMLPSTTSNWAPFQPTLTL